MDHHNLAQVTDVIALLYKDFMTNLETL